MNRRTRTHTLVHAEKEFLQRLEEKIVRSHSVLMLEEPHHALVMMKMRETARHHLFYLGEVLVSECRVRLNGSLGLGIIRGDRMEEARMLAVIDACFNADSPLISELENSIYEEMQRQKEQRLRESAKVLVSRVHFETMEEEVKS